ncbi:MAG: hypothetical protein LBN95_13325 [Prevotellaceae bacterium]|jgi:hypothetical protein|nr:hypothetical protein [Prevotellaceae bacterium]
MKTKILFLLTILLCTAGCNEPVNNNEYVTEGYVICKHPCLNEELYGENNAYGKAGGYYIISTDLNDTLLTFNFPVDLFDFPVQFFHQPHLYRNEYKIKVVYKVASQEELVYSLCNDMIYNPFDGHDIQIIVKSALKIN